MKLIVAQSSLSLCDLVDCSSPGSSVHGILQARILEWVAMPSSRNSRLTPNKCFLRAGCVVGTMLGCSSPQGYEGAKGRAARAAQRRFWEGRLGGHCRNPGLPWEGGGREQMRQHAGAGF